MNRLFAVYVYDYDGFYQVNEYCFDGKFGGHVKLLGSYRWPDPQWNGSLR